MWQPERLPWLSTALLSEPDHPPSSRAARRLVCVFAARKREKHALRWQIAPGAINALDSNRRQHGVLLGMHHATAPPKKAAT